jgi:hypothetical protein
MRSYRCYDPSASGGGGIHTWYDPLPADVRAAIDATLELLAHEDDWEGHPQVEMLRGACEGLSEIKIDMPDGRKFRILGFDGPRRREFTLLYGFDKSPGHVDYGPHCHSALWRKHAVERNNSRAIPCTFP